MELRTFPIPQPADIYDRSGTIQGADENTNSTKTANVQPGETVAVFGLGAVGLAVVQGAVARNASRVIAIDTNDSKQAWAEKFGATDFINPMKLKEGETIVERLVEMTDGGLDYTL